MHTKSYIRDIKTHPSADIILLQKMRVNWLNIPAKAPEETDPITDAIAAKSGSFLILGRPIFGTAR